MHARFVALFLDGGQRQFQRSGGDQAVLLGHGIDRQWQEVQQLVVAKRAQLQLPGAGGARLPLDSVVLETDAPDMAPAMFPGVRNSPEHLPEIAGALAQVMGVEAGELAAASTRNAYELFGW